MKKYLFMALAAAAMLFSGCENLQPTEVSQKDLKDKVTVCGYARYVVNKLDGSTLKEDTPKILAEQPIVLYYGIKDAEGNMSYRHYDLKTDMAGFFTIDLPLQPGKTVIDEVKVQASFSLELATYAKNTKTNTNVRTDADFFGEVVNQNLVAGKTYYCDLLAKAVAYTSNADLEQPK